MDDTSKLDLAQTRERIKKLLVSHLVLTDKKPGDIKDNEILFGEGLGLDSLDAIEIAVMLKRNFRLEINDAELGKKVFYSIETLSNYVYENTRKN